jgi:hypothetical protein
MSPCTNACPDTFADGGIVSNSGDMAPELP